MRIALIGAYGQLGTALLRILPGDVVPLTRETIDLLDEDAARHVLYDIHPDVVINTAAYNLVDKAEEELDLAFDVNCFAPRHLALSCLRLQATLVHVSTDYVFGLTPRDTPYRETDDTDPLSMYGTTKLIGENVVQAIAPRHFVVRTCGLYGAAKRTAKENFVTKMLRLARERGEVSVVDDQWCTPTSADSLARAIAALIETDRYGLYHATNFGATTWCRFAREIFQQSGMHIPVHAIRSSDLAVKARRPAWSVLDCSKLADTIGAPLIPWEAALSEYLGSLAYGLPD